MADQSRVRFAPSPTGPLHMGGVRTALYNYLFARQQDGKLILRLEDTDETRYVPKAEDYIVEALNWCGIECDEGFHVGGPYGPYRQSERKAGYEQYAEQLVANGHAYYCFDSSDDLEKMREDLKKQGVPSPKYDAVTRQYMKNSLTLSDDEVKQRFANGEEYVIRIRMPRKEEVRFYDEIRGWVVFQTDQLDDKVILKTNGMPTYHLANVVDDHLMAITDVIRGEEWLPSAPLHVLLYKYLGWEDQMPSFAHLPLILRPDGKGKLSKRDGDQMGFPVFPLDWTDPETGDLAPGFREKGFFPEAFVNILAFLGWNPGTDQEIYTMDQLIRDFAIQRVGKAGARFDFEKAKWFNQQFIKDKDDEELASMVQPILEQHGVTIEDPEFLKEFCRLLKERVSFLPDFWQEGYYFFQKPAGYDQKVVQKRWSDDIKTHFEEIRKQIEAVEDFNGQNLEAVVKNYIKENELKFGWILPLVRVMLTGVMQGPPVFDLAALIGKDETLTRMDEGIQAFDGIIKNA